MPQIPPGSPGGIFSAPAWRKPSPPGGKPSPGRGWQGEALTGVGRYEPGPGTAPLPALGGVPFIRGYCGRQVVSPSSVTGFARATFPVGEGFLRRGTKPSPGRGWLGEAETGVGRYEPGPDTAPLPAPAGPPSPRGRLEGFSSKNFKIYVDILGIQW